MENSLRYLERQRPVRVVTTNGWVNGTVNNEAKGGQRVPRLRVHTREDIHNTGWRSDVPRNEWHCQVGVSIDEKEERRKESSELKNESATDGEGKPRVGVETCAASLEFAAHKLWRLFGMESVSGSLLASFLSTGTICISGILEGEERSGRRC